MPQRSLRYFRVILDLAQDDLDANSAARLIAEIILSGRATPLPAISNAVP
jgi:hypothetical protein